MQTVNKEYKCISKPRYKQLQWKLNEAKKFEKKTLYEFYR